MPSLKQLDTKCQSGGERALSTALFFLALQKLTHFPFRIVDEINQVHTYIFNINYSQLVINA